MKRLEFSGAVQPLYGSLGVKRLTMITQATEITGVLVEAKNDFSYSEALFYVAQIKLNQRVLWVVLYSLKTECRPDIYFPPACENKTTELSAILLSALTLHTRGLNTKRALMKSHSCCNSKKT